MLGQKECEKAKLPQESREREEKRKKERKKD